jgi:predicted tellurium resistance membrane protein TerC
VGMSPKRWVVITGGILGIVAMRVVVGQLIVLVERYPALVDGAFIIISWVGLKLGLEYMHELGFFPVEIPQWVSIGLVIIIFVISLIIAKRQGPSPPDAPGSSLTEKAERMFEEREG